MKARIEEIPRQRRAELGLRAGERIIGSPSYAAAAQLIAYIALPDEIAVAPVIDAAARSGKRVYLPVVVEHGSLEFHLWVPGTDLRASGLGVLEPTSGEKACSARTLVLVPGRAFDRGGRRLGRGGGYYDRSLPLLRELGPAVGVAFECQVVDAVPTEPHDARVDFLVTEAAVVDCLGSEAHGA